MEISLWHYTLQAKDRTYLEQALSGFPEGMRLKIGQYKDADRDIRIAAKILTRDLILQLGYEGKPLEVMQRDASNRPFLPQSGIQFSSAHSKHTCVVAACFAADEQIGIDLEWISTIDTHLLKDFLHTEEIALLDKQAEPEKTFYQLWTRKEALLKASGKGIYGDMKQINASAEQLSIEAKTYYSQSQFFLPGYALAVAATSAFALTTIKEIVFP